MSQERMLAYLNRLCDMTKNIEDKLQDEKIGDKTVKKMSGTAFENVVYDSLLEAGFKEEEITHNSQKFPDFVLEDLEDGDKMGVEVKKTDSAKWEVIGGSIYESLKNDIEDTYVLMAKLVQRILSNWQFDLPIFLIALFPKPRRSHRYACVWEASLSEKYSASNYPKLNFRCTRRR